MTERVIMAGWGGQGMMLLGKMLAEIMMHEGREVTFFPSYGAEVRGGTCHSQVMFGDEPIYSPIVEEADSLIMMNRPSYEKFRPRLVPNGLLLINSSIARPDPDDDAGTLLEIPATEIASELGAVRVANVVMLGAYNTIKKIVPADTILKELKSRLTGRKAALWGANRLAYERGEEIGKEHASR